jgi:hypothetical protein
VPLYLLALDINKTNSKRADSPLKGNEEQTSSIDNRLVREDVDDDILTHLYVKTSFLELSQAEDGENLFEN